MVSICCVTECLEAQIKQCTATVAVVAVCRGDVTAQAQSLSVAWIVFEATRLLLQDQLPRQVPAVDTLIVGHKDEEAQRDSALFHTAKALCNVPTPSWRIIAFPGANCANLSCTSHTAGLA
jgi:hypothetical protein